MEIEINTVSSVDIPPDGPCETNTVGSWANERDAVIECAEYIVDRCAMRPDIRYALMHDEEHLDLIVFASDRSGIGRREIEESFSYSIDEGWNCNPGVEAAIKEYLIDRISMSMVYEILTCAESEIGASTWIFEVSKNILRMNAGIDVGKENA